MKRKDEEVNAQIDKRAKDIQKEIEEMLEDEYKFWHGEDCCAD